jgi:integrase
LNIVISLISSPYLKGEEKASNNAEPTISNTATNRVQTTSCGIFPDSAFCLKCRMRHLRHSFVVRRLTSWYEQGADVQKLLPHLATYLGHVSIAATQVYLTMTPELLRAASLRFERYAFPGANHD